MNTTFDNYGMRSLTIEDGQQLFELINRNRLRLRDYFPVTSSTVTSLASCFKFVDEKVLQAQRNEHFSFVIEDEHQHLIGLFFLKNLDWRIPKGELAYFIDKDHLGKGIMTRAMAEVVRYCFNSLAMNKLFIITATDNYASKRIAEKNGFEQEGLLRKNFRIASGELVDNIYFGLLRG